MQNGNKSCSYSYNLPFVLTGLCSSTVPRVAAISAEMWRNKRRKSAANEAVIKNICAAGEDSGGQWRAKLPTPGYLVAHENKEL